MVVFFPAAFESSSIKPPPGRGVRPEAAPTADNASPAVSAAAPPNLPAVIGAVPTPTAVAAVVAAPIVSEKKHNISKFNNSQSLILSIEQILIGKDEILNTIVNKISTSL